MEEDIPTIWVRVRRKGKNQIHLGGIYREHRYITQKVKDNLMDIKAQEERWGRIIKIWKKGQTMLNAQSWET